MTARTARVEPIFGSKPHATDPSGSLAVWYTEPPGVVIQLLTAREGTLELVQWLAGPSRAQTERRFHDRDDLQVLFDVRLLTGRAPEVRAQIMELAKAMRPRVKRVVVLPPRDWSPALRRTLEVTVSILRVFGLQIAVAQTPLYFLAETGARPLEA
jgi:hypothetical protein